MDWRDDTFPIGSTLRDDGAVAITELIAGEPAGGRYRAKHTGEPGPVPFRPLLVTMSTRQRVDAAALFADLDMTNQKVAHLQWIGPFESARGRYDVMIEEEPEGVPLTDAPRPSAGDAIALCREIAEALVELHDYGWIVRGIRPELTYVEGTTLAGLVPRHELFMMTATPPSYGVARVFDRTYMAPELLANRKPQPACDVFSVSAMLAELVTGRHPFGDAVGFALVERIIAGKREAWTGPAALGKLLDRGLATDPARRPGAAEFAAELGRLPR
jgi:protein kinase-like protein